MEKREVLEALADNLEANIDDLEQRIKSVEVSNRARDLVLEVLESKKVDTSLTASDWNAALLGGSRIALTQSGYEFLKNTGYNILTNRELNREIVGFYENIFKKYENSLRWNEDFTADLDPFVREQFIGRGNDKGDALPGLIPRDISVLLNNNYFYGLLDASNTARFF